MEFQMKTLKSVSQQEVLSVFNKSFSDYFVSLQLSEKQFFEKLISNNIDFSLSVGAFENNKLVGFILHGVNAKSVYNSGTGVIPKRRGFGLTIRMYKFILPILKSNQISKVVLEVITENIQAIKSYKKVGFLTRRELNCYRGKVVAISVNQEFLIKPIQKMEWKKIQSCWEVLPSFQNSTLSIENTNEGLIKLGAYFNDILVGYLIYNSKNKQIKQIGVDKTFRNRKVASSLINHITVKYGNDLSVINVDKISKSLNCFFSNIGLSCFIVQIEMELKL